jgi:hypothetical protein
MPSIVLTGCARRGSRRLDLRPHPHVSGGNENRYGQAAGHSKDWIVRLGEAGRQLRGKTSKSRNEQMFSGCPRKRTFDLLVNGKRFSDPTAFMS